MSAPSKIKVLVAEDDEMLLDLIVRWLEAAGYWVVRARDGERALQAVGETGPAAIVMDLSMPRVDGFQVLSALKENGFASIPVLVLTGRQSADDVRKAIFLGARDYMTKPVERAQLLARVERMLRKSHAQPGQTAG